MAKDRRRSELAKIHIGAKQLFDDDGDYRAMLESVAGVRSAADADEAGRRRVIEHLKACGVRFGRPARERPRVRPAPEVEHLIRKIDALCINHPTGRKPRSYAEGILRRMTSDNHRTPLEWAKPRQLGDVIAALENHRKRHGEGAAKAAGALDGMPEERH